MSSAREDTTEERKVRVPFFRPDVGEAEISEVVEVLRSGWLTTGPTVKRFEADFASAVGASHAVAVNSGTAALHLAVEALGLKPSMAVLVPTMTFTATAEVIRHCGATPILVDCDPVTLNLDLEDAERKLRSLQAGTLPNVPRVETVGIIPVHVGGVMVDLDALDELASAHGLWVIEDAAHAFPSAWRAGADEAWRRCGEATSSVACFSFYANKTITTGEGGMAVTEDAELAERMRLMSLHGLSRDAWRRYSDGGSWDYRVLAPGFKYNFTDVAAAIGVHQLKRAESMRLAREAVARAYHERLSELSEIELPTAPDNRIHSWHLYPIRLNLEQLTVDRNRFIDELKERGVQCSVHWRPLHLHPYFQQELEWSTEALPVATGVWKRLVSLPLFPTMSDVEVDHVCRTVAELCRSFSR